ncbi:hypothetical protein F6U93_13210 [Tamlana haliotis]|uniref:Uncharacterized protein n=1 Tax=Pseudotamlana haliotis TaxID=2614804 RepID=A0A6N6M9C7_9FLAO|nr:hypothetical protein [Tamlana haliotis]KAB1066808.1 hypothetical protein F6U93_13210 [Tamlana haliotis]
MNIQILPNWCKKLGLVVFFLGTIISIVIGLQHGLLQGAYQEGLHATKNHHNCNVPCESLSKLEKKQCTIKGSENLDTASLHLAEILSIIGMIVYIISKEKIEDDYINKLRLDAYVLTVLILLCVSLLIYIISGNIDVKLEAVLNIFLILYLFIFFFKKRIY